MSFTQIVWAQEPQNNFEKKIRLGLNYGGASQANFPFDNENYQYSNNYLKVQINYPLLPRTKWKFELNIEPSVYFSDHQLLNKYFLKPEYGPNFVEQTERFMKPRSFNEYVLSIGLIARHGLNDNLSVYASLSSGPMLSGAETERLNKGFAFSNILGFGTSCNMKGLILDLRLTFRHNSNMNFYTPNHGHNSVGLESGISFQL